MKKFLLVILGLSLVVGVVIYFKRQPTLPPIELVEETLAFNHQERRPWQEPDIAVDLTRAVATNPDYVITCLVIIKARRRPGISPEDEERVLTKARHDSTAALNELRELLYREVTHRMEEFPRTDAGRFARGQWLNDNPAMALLFVELPIAERIGKKRQLITEELEGYRSDRRQPWYRSSLSSKQYMAWYLSGQWPFKDEEPPIYRPKKKA
jgi:hypothetical protein